MNCRSCGAEIADKAIVCYRCGTATALPSRPAHSTHGGVRRRPNWGIVAAMIVIVALGAWLIPKTPPGSPERIAAWVATWMVAFIVMARARRRRRR